MNRILFRVRDTWSGNSSRVSQTQTLLPAHKRFTRVWNILIRFLPKSERWIGFNRIRNIWSGNLSRFSQTQTLLPAHKWYTRVWNRWIRFFFTKVWLELISFILELEVYLKRINPDSVRHRHYYELTSVKQDSEIDELFYLPKSERD